MQLARQNPSTAEVEGGEAIDLPHCYICFSHAHAVMQPRSLLCEVIPQYMNKLLFAGRSALIQSRTLVRPVELSPRALTGAYFVRRASMSNLYPSLDIKGQTVLITGNTS